MTSREARRPSLSLAVREGRHLTELAVRYQGRDMGTAVPFRITRHVHPDAATSAPPPAAPTGIDYLNLLATDHQQQLAAITIDYDRLTTSTSAAPTGAQATEQDGQLPGQLDLTELPEAGTHQAGAS